MKKKYGKINEYKIVESKYKGSRSVEMVFKRDNGTYAGTDIIKYLFKIIHNELGIKNKSLENIAFYIKIIYNTPSLILITIFSNSNFPKKHNRIDQLLNVNS